MSSSKDEPYNPEITNETVDEFDPLNSKSEKGPPRPLRPPPPKRPDAPKVAARPQRPSQKQQNTKPRTEVIHASSLKVKQVSRVTEPESLGMGACRRISVCE